VKILKKLFKLLVVSASFVLLFFVASIGVANYFTPDSFQVTAGSKLEWNMNAITAVTGNYKEVTTDVSATESKSYKAQLMLYHIIPIKTVNVDVVNDTMLVPCGTPFGIKLFTNGVVIVGVADIQTSSGTVNPAAISGLKVGDVITAINGKKVNTNAEIIDTVLNGSGACLRLSVCRNNTAFSVNLQPVKSETDSTYKAGLWVRDSTAGIGTLTFYNPSTKCFGGLGHGVCDTDTNELMPLLDGEIVPVTINGITKGEKGSPGELRGYFTTDTAMGTLDENVSEGVYGTMKSIPQGKAIEVAMKQEVKSGSAQILTTIDGNGPQYYDAEIEKIDFRDNLDSKNMIVHITDNRLLTQTGGIVQGMSGSPIIQNGKIIGAVTHVFVNDPTRGYGIFAENMLAISQNYRSTVKSKAS
jgi:stage IV sporulation protein B